MQESKARFIILRKIRFEEADLIVHALSIKGGKFSLIAKGAMRSKKRFGGGILEPGNFVEFTYQRKNERSMGFLKEARMIQDFSGIRNSYEKIEFALKVLELVGKIAQEGDESSEHLFNLLGHGLAAIEKIKAENSIDQLNEKLELLKMAINLKLLYQQGVLELEPWMKPFLSIDLKSIDQIDPVAKEALPRLTYIEQLVEHYAATAGT